MIVAAAESGIPIFVWILLGAFVLVVLWFIGAYNGLVRLRNRVKNAWSQIDVQLKRRHDLIPNLVNTAKGYLKHEREVLENVTKARQQAVDVSGVKNQAEAENFLSQTLKSLFAVAENYPDLKGNTNMLSLQEELSSTENKIAFARQHYNDSAMRFNTKIEQFPTNTIAGMFNFEPAEFFEIEVEAERQVPKVEF
jgi:LemA protein